MTGQFDIQKINRSQLEILKNIFRRYHYTYNQFTQLGVNPFAYDQYYLPIFAHQYGQSTSFGILFHLFFLGRSVKLNNIKKIFPQKDIDGLLKIKIFEKINATNLQSSVQILPYKDYFFACDFILQLEDRGSSKHAEYEPVYPVRLDSLTLSEVSIKKSVESVLDLGCGSGFLSIIASRHSQYVVGTDLNPRAINFSTFNAYLNNITNCRFICGDLYQPIDEEKYDLILSNPPYEIAINKTNLFQDGGEYGHKVLKRIIKGAPLHLTKNGFCQIITKIAEFQNESKEKTFKKWLSDEKAHIFFLLLYKMSIDESVYSICIDLFTYKDKSLHYKKYSENISKILQHFEIIHFSHISFGLIILTKSAQYKYIEQQFNSTNILASDLSEKLQYYIYRHFIKSLGFFGLFYFLKYSLNKIRRQILPALDFKRNILR